MLHEKGDRVAGICRVPRFIVVQLAITLPLSARCGPLLLSVGEEGYISKSDLLQVESCMSDAEYQLSAAEQEILWLRTTTRFEADAHTNFSSGCIDNIGFVGDAYALFGGGVIKSNPQHSSALSAIDVSALGGA